MTLWQADPQGEISTQQQNAGIAGIKPGLQQTQECTAFLLCLLHMLSATGCTEMPWTISQQVGSFTYCCVVLCLWEW